MLQLQRLPVVFSLSLFSTILLCPQAQADQAPKTEENQLESKTADKADSAAVASTDNKSAEATQTSDEQVQQSADSDKADNQDKEVEAGKDSEAEDNDALDNDNKDKDKDEDEDEGADQDEDDDDDEENDEPKESIKNHSPVQFCAGDFCLEPGLRLRLRYDAIEDDATVAYVGRNDGFGLSSARLKLRGNYGWADFKLEFEGGFIRQTDSNIVAGRTFAAIKDAWIHARPFDFFEIWAGQFKVPFSAESMRSSANLHFSDYSVGERGIRAAQGYQVNGLGQPRDVGIMLGADGFQLGPVTLLYLASVTNGNGIDQAYNDNSYPALHGRMELGLWDMAYIGAGALYNPRTVGLLPNLYDEAHIGAVADFGLRLRGGFIDGSYTYMLTQYPTTGSPDSVAMAAHIEAGYQLWFGLGAAYRFAWFDPSSTFDYDALTEHSVAIRYDLPGAPVALVIDYTIALEQAGRELQNNRIGGMLQIDF